MLPTPPSRGATEVILRDRLPARAESIPRARRSLDALIDETLADADRTVLEDIRLLTSELVTNSVRHAGLREGETVELRVRSSPGTLLVEVVDGGPGFRRGAPAPSFSPASGWGLYLVDRLADRWGVETNDVTCVWFEIDRPS